MPIFEKKEIMCWWREIEEKGADELILCHNCANHKEDHPMTVGDIFNGNLDDIYICNFCGGRIDTEPYLRKYGAPEKTI